MSDFLDSLREETLARIDKSGSEAEIEQLRIETLGRKGRLTLLLRGLKDLAVDERPRAGEQLNQLRELLEARLQDRLRPSRRGRKKKRYGKSRSMSRSREIAGKRDTFIL